MDSAPRPLPSPQEMQRALHESREKMRTGKPVCPAARMGRFADSGSQYVFCQIEGTPFKVDDSPFAAQLWCCHNYKDCPVWQDEHMADGATVARVREARERRRTDRINAQHRRLGIRVDDEAA